VFYILDSYFILDILFFGNGYTLILWVVWYISEAVDLLRCEYGGERVNRKAEKG
jgi:hypothetical protein